MLPLLGFFFGIFGGIFISRTVLLKDYSWLNLSFGIAFLGWLIFLFFKLAYYFIFILNG